MERLGFRGDILDVLEREDEEDLVDGEVVTLPEKRGSVVTGTGV